MFNSNDDEGDATTLRGIPDRDAGLCIVMSVQVSVSATNTALLLLWKLVMLTRG
jgi:hypothetical protein